MKIHIILFAISVALALPVTASLAQDDKTTVVVMPVTPMPEHPTPQTVEARTMICREARAPIGTRFKGPRVCKTQQQWDAEMYEEQHNVAKSQIRGCLSSGVCPQ